MGRLHLTYPANIAKVTELRQSHHPSPNPSYP